MLLPFYLLLLQSLLLLVVWVAFAWFLYSESRYLVELLIATRKRQSFPGQNASAQGYPQTPSFTRTHISSSTYAQDAFPALPSLPPDNEAVERASLFPRSSLFAAPEASTEVQPSETTHVTHITHVSPLSFLQEEQPSLPPFLSPDTPVSSAQTPSFTRTPLFSDSESIAELQTPQSQQNAPSFLQENRADTPLSMPSDFPFAPPENVPLTPVQDERLEHVFDGGAEYENRSSVNDRGDTPFMVEQKEFPPVPSTVDASLQRLELRQEDKQREG